jgi:hypothetical protein
MSHTESHYSNITVVQRVTPALRGRSCLTQLNQEI